MVPAFISTVFCCSLVLLSSVQQTFPTPLSGLQVQQGLAGSLAANQQLLAPGALQQQPQVYDPLAGMDVNKLNTIFIQRQQPALTGAFLRPM